MLRGLATLFGCMLTQTNNSFRLRPVRRVHTAAGEVAWRPCTTCMRTSGRSASPPPFPVLRIGAAAVWPCAQCRAVRNSWHRGATLRRLGRIFAGCHTHLLGDRDGACEDNTWKESRGAELCTRRAVLRPPTRIIKAIACGCPAPRCSVQTERSESWGLVAARGCKFLGTSQIIRTDRRKLGIAGKW